MVCLLVGAWSVGFFSEVSGGAFVGVWFVLAARGRRGGGVVFMICLVW